jgi:hypothetical protein
MAMCRLKAPASSSFSEARMQSARILVATSERAARLMGPSTSIMKWFSSWRATVSTSRAAPRRISPMRDSAAPRFWSLARHGWAPG